jgi:thiaminase/transcriptional activator TenA
MMETTAAKTRVSRELWTQAAPHAFRSLFHPFVAGLAAGTLPSAAFRAFLLQDAYYLTGFAKVSERRGLDRVRGRF